MYTIKEIAQLAGVAQSTVSRVLNNRPDVSKETKEKVLKIIDEYNYIPNANAKGLKQMSTNNICVLVRGIANTFFSGIVEQIQKEIELFSYDPLVHYIDEHDDEFIEAKRLILEKKPQGIIFLGGRILNHEDEVKSLSIPCVFATVYTKNLQIPNVSCVSIDDRIAAKNAVSKLLENGHTDIIILGGERKEIDLVYNRYNGVLDSFKERNLEFDERRYFDCKFSFSSSYKAMIKALESNINITAVFTMSDIMAIGAAKAISNKNLKIPDDISIVGFDGLEFAFYYEPSLATVIQPAKEIALRSVEVLVQNIIGRNKGVSLILESSFTMGNSIKKIN